MKKYDPAQIEPKWQKLWAKNKFYQAVDGDKSNEKYYVLVEFPYPSGDGLHTGHVRSYTAQDIIARRLRMKGKNVMYPMGWDAFGLPTENFAIKHKIRPQDATAKNVATFKRQMQALGLSFDWSREINTTDPKYYKWTQWIFLQLLKADLAYQAEIAINWCPHCKTGLANEEVVNGVHERCGTPVEKKLLKQWLLKITKYADRLIKDLDTVDYLSQIATQQINWIGKSHGSLVKFPLIDSKKSIEVFTTRIDTIYSGTFLVLSPEHPMVDELTTDDYKSEIEKYVKRARNKTDIDRLDIKNKTGVYTGSKVINPASEKEIPVYVADFVLSGYGTGAVFADAHDERDVEFARKYGIPLKTSIEPVTGTPQKDPVHRNSIVALVKDPKNNRILTINWGKHAGGRLLIGGGLEDDEDPIECAKREILEETGYSKVKFLEQSETIHHHYYAHSKNEPREISVTGLFFELESDDKTKPKLEKNEQGKFKVEWLSEDEAGADIEDELHAYVFAKFIHGKIWSGDGILYNSGKFNGLSSAEARKKITDFLAEKKLAKHSTQYKLRDWVFSRQHYWGEPIPVIHCEKCGVVPVPENQLPVELPDVEHYEPTDTGESPLANITDWVNVDCPSCGGKAKRETDTMPNWAGSSWYYLRYIDPNNDKEFAAQDKLKYWLPVDLYNGGMEHTTLHLLYSRFWHKFLYDQGFVPTDEPYAMRRSHGMILAPDGNKMSKSKGNVINPDDVIAKFGADSLRMYEMFMGPYDQAIDWSDDKLAGIYRFLNRVWDLVESLSSQNKKSIGQTAEDGVFETSVDRMVHKTLKKIDQDLDNRQFNTIVSALMELVNFLNEPKTRERLASKSFDELAKRTAEILVLMLAPITPHIAEELWQQLGQLESVHLQSWPKYDPKLVKDDIMTIVVQVNGKLRGEFVAPAGASQDELEKLANDANNDQDFTKDKEIVKTIVVPGRLVNFVTK